MARHLLPPAVSGTLHQWKQQMGHSFPVDAMVPSTKSHHCLCCPQSIHGPAVFCCPPNVDVPETFTSCTLDTQAWKVLSTHPVSDLQKGQFPFEHRFFKSQIHLQGEGFRHKRQTTLGKNKKHLESRNSIGLWTRCSNSWAEVRAGVKKDRELMKVTSVQARFIKKKKGIFCFIIFLTHNQHLKVAPITLLSSAHFTD